MRSTYIFMVLIIWNVQYSASSTTSPLNSSPPAPTTTTASTNNIKTTLEGTSASSSTNTDTDTSTSTDSSQSIAVTSTATSSATSVTENPSSPSTTTVQVSISETSSTPVATATADNSITNSATDSTGSRTTIVPGSTSGSSATPVTTATTDNSITNSATDSTGSRTTTVPGSTSGSSATPVTTATTDKSTTNNAPDTTSATPSATVTTDENTGDVSSTISITSPIYGNTTSDGHTTSNGTMLTSDSPYTSQPSTTPTTTPSTTTIGINGNYTINTENAYLTLPINVTFPNGCVEKDQARDNITNALLDLNMTVAHVDFFLCTKNNGKRRKRSDELRGMLVDAVGRARDFIGNPTAESKINDSITKAFNKKVEVDTNAASELTMCDTDVCREASLKYKGFTCKSGNVSNSDCIFTSMCTNHDCDYGDCEVKANGSHYYRVCICQEEDMYKYTVSADKCVKGDLSYKAWMIIAAGAGGLIILILLFAVVIQCARRKRKSSNPEKYVYDAGYSDRETLVQDRSYDHIDQYHRKPSLKVEDSRIQTSLQTFDNQGYDHWDPDESKETYQSMDRHFQSPNFQAQITRPKLTTSRYGEDKLTPF